MHAFLKGSSGGPPKFKEKSTLPGTSDKSSKPKRQVPWVEKYRPRTINDVAYQDEVVSVLKKSLQGADLPMLLFYGPPGTGKTSTILAAARELFGNDMYKDRVLELNASDERGIDVVRQKVKRFAQLTASGTRPDGRPCPPFKIIILDEADSMTGAAQAALRRTMEKESKTTRFCLICNYVSRIIEPLTSRCAKFRFKPLSEEILMKRLKFICDSENVKYDESAIRALMTVSEGDLRKAITYLQSAFRLKGEDNITEEDISEIAGVCPQNVIDKVVKVCQSDSYEKLDKRVKALINDGFSGSQLLLQLHDTLINSPDLSDNQKAVVFEKMGVVDKCLMDGADEYLQMMALLSTIMDQMCHSK